MCIRDSINTSPWSEVFVDGRSIGQTPLGDVSVTAGPHQLRLVDGQGRELRRNVRVEAESTTRIFERFAIEPGASD